MKFSATTMLSVALLATTAALALWLRPALVPSAASAPMALTVIVLLAGVVTVSLITWRNAQAPASVRQMLYRQNAEQVASNRAETRTTEGTGEAR